MSKIMYKLWLSVIAISLGIALWFCVSSVCSLWNYYQCKEPILVDKASWTVHENSPSTFFMRGQYFYTVEGVAYQGETLFTTPVYLNRYAAIGDIPLFEKGAWTVWYQKNHPEKSTLRRYFPMKELTHTVLTLGITLYFYLLGRWKGASLVSGLKIARKSR